MIRGASGIALVSWQEDPGWVTTWQRQGMGAAACRRGQAQLPHVTHAREQEVPWETSTEPLIAAPPRPCLAQVHLEPHSTGTGLSTPN